MAFTDALIAGSGARVVMVDRRHAPGGHWLDAYPFVRLHMPSQAYGVNSLALGNGTIDGDSPNRGLHERACGPEICAYYDRVMRERLLASGQVRYFPMCEYAGQHRFTSRVTGERYEVKVRGKLVDATYMEPSVPATSMPPFETAPGVHCVPVGELPRAAGARRRFRHHRRRQDRGWHTIQLAVLGFIGICGVLRTADSPAPRSVQRLGTALAVAALATTVTVRTARGLVSVPVQVIAQLRPVQQCP